MKTIQSIIQAIVCNLLPSDMAYPLVTFFNMIIPVLAIIILRIVLYAVIYSQTFTRIVRVLHETSELPRKEVWILKYEDT